jgi:uncharacterized protein (TIGR02996 family)
MPSERAALVAAILEAPEDDAPRLVCADWFEEQGDEASVARADFIRTQVQRARLAPDDERHSELEARELRLLKRWAPVWCGSHFLFRKVRFRRGFIEYVHLHLRHFLHHRRQLLALEPLRDVRLTGWFRAPADLIRRVAGCEEWRHIETLRIHHQGPHKDPRGEVVGLLESPHLSRLRSLRCSRVDFDADARRRFERLEVLRRVTALQLPCLNTYPNQPGDWLCDGGEEFAEQWQGLQSLTLPHDLSGALLRRLSARSWWGRLTALGHVDPAYGQAEVWSILQDRLPEQLQELRLAGAPLPAGEALLERLGQAPLRCLHLGFNSLPAATLARLLDGRNRWRLKELSLHQWGPTEEHARVIAQSPGTESLLSLGLSGNCDLDGAMGRALFAGGRLQLLGHLYLSGASLGTEGLLALAAAPGWGRLRSLHLSGSVLEAAGLRALLASANLGRLVWLGVGDGAAAGSPRLDVGPDMALAMTRLPHLVSLELHVRHLDEQSKRILSESDSLAWVSTHCEDEEEDVQSWRASRSPGRTPPVDAAFDGLLAAARQE